MNDRNGNIGDVSMQVAPVAVLVGALLLALGTLVRAPFSVAFFASLAFGSTSIVTLAGSSVLLYVPLAGLLVAGAAIKRTFWRDLGRVFKLHWTSTAVLALLVYGVASAFVLPRLFAGATTVFVPARGAIVETALRPVSGNINQAAYFTMGIAAFFAIAGQLNRDGRFDALRIGFFTFACSHTLLGLIDLAGKASGAGDLLAPLRTAGFSMLVEVQVEGFWRIVGAYSEASTFAGGSILALAFTFSYWRETNWRPALIVAVRRPDPPAALHLVHGVRQPRDPRGYAFSLLALAPDCGPVELTRSRDDRRRHGNALTRARRRRVQPGPAQAR